MVLRVRLLEVGGSTGGALGKAFFPFTFGGALGKAFFPSTFLCGTRAIGGGAKRSTSESYDWPSFFFTSLPRGDAKRGLERTSNSSSPDTGSLGRVAVKPPQRPPPNTTFERATCPCWGGPFHELDTPKCVGKATPLTMHAPQSCDIGHTHKVAERDQGNASFEPRCGRKDFLTACCLLLLLAAAAAAC